MLDMSFLGADAMNGRFMVGGLWEKRAFRVGRATEELPRRANSVTSMALNPPPRRGAPTPVVQDDELVLDRNGGSFQFTDGADCALGRQISRWIVVQPHDENTRMTTPRLLNQIVQKPKIIVVPGEQDSVVKNGIGQVYGIGRSRETGVDRDPDVMSCFA
jgi:hypothetical protein